MGATIVITLDIDQADEEEVRLYLDYVKKQMEKYTKIKMSEVTVVKPSERNKKC